MSTIDFTCQKCEGNFELELQDLVDGSEVVECPHCNAKLGKVANEDFTAALGELQAQMMAIAKKFTVTIELDSEDLGAGDLDEDEDEDEDDEEDDDSDEDEDDDFDNEDEDLDDDDR